MKKFVLVLAVMHCIYVSAQDPPTKKYQSLLWEISGNGLEKPSYLYGTMHISSKVAFHLNDTFFISLSHCAMIANEFNLESWMSENAEMKKARNAIEFLKYYSTPTNFYQKAFKLELLKSDDLLGILKYYPSFVDHMLYRTYGEDADYEEDTYLDMFIYQAGKKMNKKIGGLEEFKKAEELVNKAMENVYSSNYTDEQSERKRLRLAELKKGYYSTFNLIEDAYRKGDLDLIDTVEKLIYSEKYMHFMLYARNVIMANSLDSIMKYSTVFAGVGCAHLAGDSGVINLLRKKGYTMRPMNYASSSGIDSKYRTQLDNTRLPVQFISQSTSDSVFTVSVPGKLYEYTNETDGTKSYVCNDLANACYYYISRTNHFGRLVGKTEDYMLQRIDSVFYEAIPGEILHKEKIYSNCGYPGYDIENKTKTGDIQHYRIYISPDEIILFKMSGTSNYVGTGDESTKFFSSISFKPDNDKSFKEFISKTGGYKVTLPANYSYYKSNDPTDMRRELVTAGALNSNDYYFMMEAKLFDYSYIEEDTFELNMIAENFAEDLGFKILSRTITDISSHPALDVILNNNYSDINLRIIINGPFYYMLGCRTNEKKQSENFMNSFCFTEITYEKPFRDYSDTTLHFTVKTQFEENPYVNLIKEEKSQYSYFYSSQKDNNTATEYLPQYLTRYYVSSETGEQVYVYFNKYSMFYQVKSMDDFWNKEIKSIIEKNGLILSRKKSEKINNTEVMTFLLTDTSSSRGILVKMIQKCGILYTLKATIDTLSGPGNFVKTFMTSFTPADTCIGIDLTSDKVNEYLFAKIFSADTNERKKALVAIEYAIGNFSDGHAKSLIKIIQDTAFKHLPFDKRIDLIEALGTIKSKETLPFLKTLYTEYNDSITMQFAVLRAVASMKTENSAKAFVDLLSKDLIVSTKQYDIDDMFYDFKDSLEIGAKLFPDILKLTKYKEYRKPIYELLGKLVEKNKISERKYAEYKNDIIRDAKYDLALLLAANDNNSYSSGSYYNYYSSYYSSSKNYSLNPADDLTLLEKELYYLTVILRPCASNSYFRKEIIAKIIKSGSDDLAICISSQYLKNGLNISDTLWNYYSSKPDTKVKLYQALTYVGRLDKFNPKYLNTEGLASAQLFSEKFDLKKDTIVLLDKKYVQSKKGNGYVYIFKACGHDKTLWKLGYTGIQPTESNKLNLDPDLSENSISFENDKQMNEKIKDLMKDVRVLGHHRYSGYDYGYYGYDYNNY